MVDANICTKPGGPGAEPVPCISALVCISETGRYNSPVKHPIAVSYYLTTNARLSLGSRQRLGEGL